MDKEYPELPVYSVDLFIFYRSPIDLAFQIKGVLVSRLAKDVLLNRIMTRRLRGEVTLLKSRFDASDERQKTAVTIQRRWRK